MKITNKQLRQIIKEELEAVMNEGFLDSAIDYGKKAFGFGAKSAEQESPAAVSGDEMKEQAKKDLVQYFNNFVNGETSSSGMSKQNFVEYWIGGLEGSGKKEWTEWWPLYNAWRTSSTGPKGISPEELIPLTVEALTPVVVGILKHGNNSRFFHERNVRKFIEEAHTYGNPYKKM